MAEKCPLCEGRVFEGKCLKCGFEIRDEKAIEAMYDLDPDNDNFGADGADSQMDEVSALDFKYKKLSDKKESAQKPKYMQSVGIHKNNPNLNQPQNPNAKITKQQAMQVAALMGARNKTALMGQLQNLQNQQSPPPQYNQPQVRVNNPQPPAQQQTVRRLPPQFNNNNPTPLMQQNIRPDPQNVGEAFEYFVKDVSVFLQKHWWEFLLMLFLPRVSFVIFTVMYLYAIKGKGNFSWLNESKTVYVILIIMHFIAMICSGVYDLPIWVIDDLIANTKHIVQTTEEPLRLIATGITVYFVK